jgi:hypothetical protein
MSLETTATACINFVDFVDFLLSRHVSQTAARIRVCFTSLQISEDMSPSFLPHLPHRLVSLRQITAFGIRQLCTGSGIRPYTEHMAE